MCNVYVGFRRQVVVCDGDNQNMCASIASAHAVSVQPELTNVMRVPVPGVCNKNDMTDD